MATTAARRARAVIEADRLVVGGSGPYDASATADMYRTGAADAYAMDGAFYTVTGWTEGSSSTGVSVDDAAGAMTITAAGVFSVRAWGRVALSVLGPETITVRVAKNGAGISGLTDSDTEVLQFAIERPVHLVVGDVIVFQVSGSTSDSTMTLANAGFSVGLA